MNRKGQLEEVEDLVVGALIMVIVAAVIVIAAKFDPVNQEVIFEDHIKKFNAQKALIEFTNSRTDEGLTIDLLDSNDINHANFKVRATDFFDQVYGDGKWQLGVECPQRESYIVGLTVGTTIDEIYVPTREGPCRLYLQLQSGKTSSGGLL